MPDIPAQVEIPKRALFKAAEVCDLAKVQPYVLRYWETEFPLLAPTKSGGGQRMYTRREIDVILRIKQLLYSEGFTIAGAKKRLEIELSQPAIAEAAATTAPALPAAGAPMNGEVTRALSDVKKELSSILKMLDD